MSISAVNSSSATSQLAAFARLGGTSGTGYAASTGGTPPPRPDDSAFLDAISSALSSIGVTVADGESEASGDAAASGTADAGQALGAFLHQLMGSLRAQSGAGNSGEEGEGGEPPAGPPPGGGGRGPGNIESDLQSLLSKLTSSGSDSTASSDSNVSELQSSFSSLLSALGGSSNGNNSGSADKLASFLQALSGSLGSASAGGSLSSSGNLVDTRA